jgi:hypothetical protein
MRVGWQSPGEWSQLNERVSQALKISNDKVTVRTYLGVGAALVELTMGLSRLFPLKKKIYYFKNMDPHFEASLMHLAREGYPITALPEEARHDTASWAANWGREDLFVLYSVDDPVLGQPYDVTGIERAAREKNMIKVRVSHARHFYESDDWRSVEPFDKNTALIYGLEQPWALAVLGERVRPAPLLADQWWPAWGEPSLDLSWYSQPQNSPRARVSAFENLKPASSSPLFAEGEVAHRPHDRALIYWRDMDGHAVIDRLAKKLGIELRPPGLETRIETTSLSRWGGVRTFDFYSYLGFDAEIFRGLVMIDHKLIDESGALAKSLLEVRQSILEDQFGDH